MALLLGWYTVTRIVFGLYNRSLLSVSSSSYFPISSFREGYRIFFLGLQQDFVSLLLLNAPVIGWILIVQLRKGNAGSHPLSPSGRWVRWVFWVLNTGGWALNCIDIGYFRFSKNRSNLNLVFVFRDSMGSFGSLFTGYWNLILFFAAGVFVLFRIAVGLTRDKVYIPSDSPRPAGFFRTLLNQGVFLALMLLPCGIFQGRPVIPATPLLFVSPEKLPLAQNSILTFAYSIFNRHRELVKKNYFSKAQLDELVKTAHVMGDGRDTFQHKNVVIFILESFSRCYVIPGDPQKARTPFLDSLIRKSLFFPNSFANGFMSNQGIVSILGGLPGFVEEPFYYSAYANTPLKSIGNILKSVGYETDFFMGAGKDHFGFGKFARMAGIDHYYCRDDFDAGTSDGERFYDGNWGVFDEPFLQYGAHVLDKKQQPFMAVFFTISAHPPYTLPPSLRERFAVPGKTPAQRSIAYTDYSIEHFFEACRDEPWFRNTLFVFCADHWLSPDENTGYTYVNSSTIPIFMYDGSETGSKKEGAVRHTLATQVDLAPTVLDWLHYKGVYTGFGRSLLDSSIPDSDRYAVSRLTDTYQLITDDYVLGYDLLQDSSLYLYRYGTDSLFRKNLLRDKTDERIRKKLETLIRANIQAYNNALLQRNLQ